MSQAPSSRRHSLPWERTPIAYPASLPITSRKDEIVAAIRSQQVIVLSGETGSGKTTQIPKMCLDAGLSRKGRIACTQPRRVAALSVAKRVAEELQATYGREVGSKIRFNDQTSRQTRIKFMTDGMLLAEAQADRSLSEYEAIIIDEAHERSLNIDFLLGHLNRLRAERPDLKIIITSATIDVEKFSEAFGGAPVIEVSGRTYPVTVIYAPLDELLEDSGDFTYIDGIAESVQRIIDEFGAGDILAFLPTEKDIREAMDLAQGRFGASLEVLPCFGRLSSSDQQRIFSSSSRRKLILATNIAETSLTIPGIRYVIDTGLARLSRYNPRTRTRRLPIEKISQSSADQRKGRCGRLADGICIRLYPEKDFAARPLYSVPELQRSNLADVILRMKAARLGEVETFPFIDPPSPAAIKAGYDLLGELGALDEQRRLTPMGRKLAALPTDPTVGRMLLQAETEAVVEQALVIASALSIQDPRERPMGKEEKASQAHRAFQHPHSDFLTLLNIWEAFHEKFERMTQSKLRKFCKQHFLSYLRMREWGDVYEQLRQALADYERSKRIRHAAPTYASEDEKRQTRAYGGHEYRSIHRCLIAGLLANAARKDEPNLYRASGNRKAMIFPGSGLFNRKAAQAKRRKGAGPPPPEKGFAPEWILAGELLETSRLYARVVAAIDPDWLAELGQHIVRRRYSEPIWDPKQGRVLAKERLILHGLEIRSSMVSYLKIDPQHATEIFIREALLEENFQAPLPFLQRNRQLKRRIQNAQTTMQISSWIGVEEAAYRFYQSRLQSIASLHDLNRLLKQRNDPHGHFLLMSGEDLMPRDQEPIDLSAFPEEVELQNSALPLDYKYQPGEEDDGVTLRLPYAKAKSLQGPLLDWLVPGHLETKVHFLLKGLPKDIRRQLLPLSETAATIARQLKPSGQTLVDSLAKHLREERGIETYQSDWDPNAVPSHLRVRIEVQDEKGKVLAQGRDPGAIRQELSRHEAALSAQKPGQDSRPARLWAQARQRHERPVESIERLPQLECPLPIGEIDGVPLQAYPALRAGPDGARIHLFKSAADAKAANREGVSALLEGELRYELAWARKDLKDFHRLGPKAIAFAPLEILKEDAFERLRQEIRRHEIDTLDPVAIAEAALRAKQLSKGFLFRLVETVDAILEKRQALVTRNDLPPDLRSHIDAILPPRFLRQTPAWAIERMPLYLDGIAKRLHARQRNPQRDAQRAQTVASFIHQYKTLAQSASIAEPDLQHARFMIEELALSLFAQELGTAFPISEKRLQAHFDQLRAAGPEPPANPAPEQKPSPAKSASAPPEKQADRPTQADLDSLKKLFG